MHKNKVDKIILPLTIQGVFNIFYCFLFHFKTTCCPGLLTATDQHSGRGPRSQGGPALGPDCCAVAVLKFQMSLSLNLYFVSKVGWDPWPPFLGSESPLAAPSE